MGISMGISGSTPTSREMGLPGSQIRGGEDREFLLQAVGFNGGSQKTMGSGPRWLVSGEQ